MKPCGLLGRRLGHSYSPLIHSMLADYDYQLFEVEPGDLGAFLQAGGFHGINVTIPYKESVLPYCAQMSARAAAIGSVNTLLRLPDDTLWGDNTDAEGFSWMLERSKIQVKGKKVLVLGSGGASRAVHFVLRQLGAGEIVGISRSGANHYGNLHLHRDAQVIVNTTPVGMYPETGIAPVDLSRFPDCEGVLDLIYNPARTTLLLDAEELGIPHMGGLSMLVGQARAAAEHFSGSPVSRERAEDVLFEIGRRMENIVLIGMPGCGKSTAAQALAKRLGRSFVDADKRVEEAAGCPIPELFRREGENGFRRRETAVLEALGRQSGLVIATGGGCVTRAENYRHLHQNGRIVFLERDLSLLESEGRPLSQSGNLEEMYQIRLPHYRRFADVTVTNSGEIAHVADEIWEGFYEVFSH